MIPKTFTAERIFKATRKDVWRALTEKDLMKQWYFDLPEFKAEVGFTFKFNKHRSPEISVQVKLMIGCLKNRNAAAIFEVEHIIIAIE